MKTIFKILLISLFFALIAMGLISCGARKVNIEKQKEETKTEVIDNSVTDTEKETNTKTTTTVKTDDKNETVAEEISYTPDDPTKESFIIEKDGTKTVLSNVKKTVKKTIQKNNTQTQKSGNYEIVQKEVVKEQKKINNTNTSQKENKSKQTERTVAPWYWYLLLIIPICIIYYFCKRCKII